jgi:hypothetical protein
MLHTYTEWQTFKMIAKETWYEDVDWVQLAQDGQLSKYQISKFCTVVVNYCIMMQGL